jgi:integrase
MASIHYYTEAERKKKYLILLTFTFNHYRLRLSTGIHVPVKAWDQKAQKAKPIEDFQDENKRLRQIESFLLDEYDEQFPPGTDYPSEIVRQKAEEIKRAFQVFSGKRVGQDNTVTIFQYIDDFKECYKNKLSHNYLKHYTSLKTHLLNFEKESGFQITFESIGKEFYNRFTDYMRLKGKKINTIGANLRRLKRLMNEALEDKLTENTGHRGKNFRVLNEDVDAIYLTEEEIKAYWELNLVDERYRQIRDLFVLHCYTGLRHSDWYKVSPDNIRNGNLHILTQKTKEPVVIPLHPMVQEILVKYCNNLPTPSNSEVNRVLKIIAEYAKINNLGGVAISKWSQITCHTARRSFATNAYLGGIPMYSVMQITGHKKTETFLRYIRVSKLENAMKLKEHPFFRGK